MLARDGSKLPTVAMLTFVASISDPAPLMPRPPEPFPVVPIVAPMRFTTPPLLATTAYAAVPVVEIVVAPTLLTPTVVDPPL